MQRLRDMSSTKEGKEYIRDLSPDTINFLRNAGYEDELKQLLKLSAPSFYLFKEDPIYWESYMAGLQIDKSRTEVVRSDYSIPDPMEVGECTDGVEIPWYKIKLPESGTYQIKEESMRGVAFTEDEFSEDEPKQEPTGDGEGDGKDDDESSEVTAEDEVLLSDEMEAAPQKSNEMEEQTPDDKKQITEVEKQIAEVEDQTAAEDKATDATTKVAIQEDEPPSKDCIETYEKKFRLLVNTPEIYYHEPQYENLRMQYDDGEDDECEDNYIIPWKDIMLRINATIIPTKNLEIISSETEEKIQDEEDEDCLCDICPAVENIEKNKIAETDSTPPIEQNVETTPAPVQEVPDDISCMCMNNESPLIKEKEVTNTCAANTPRPLTSPKISLCGSELCTKVDQTNEQSVDDPCQCKPTQPQLPPPFTCICTIEDTKPTVTTSEETKPSVPNQEVSLSKKELMEKGNCLCIQNRKKKNEKFEKAYCFTHMCHALNPTHINLNEERYEEDDCTCKFDDKNFLELKKFCYACRTPIGKKNANTTRTQYQQQNITTKEPSQSNNIQARQVACLAPNMDLIPINTQSVCDSSLKPPFKITIRTLSTPLISANTKVIKSVFKSPLLAKDFQCQCNPKDTKELVDECVCTETTLQTNVNKCDCNNKPATKDPVMVALAAYQAEIKPLKETLYQLREKIRDLRLTDAQGSTGRNVDDLYSNTLPSSSNEEANLSSNNNINDGRKKRNQQTQAFRAPVNLQAPFYHPGK